MSDFASKATPNKAVLEFFLITLDVRIRRVSHIAALNHHNAAQKDVLSKIHCKRDELRSEIQKGCAKIGNSSGVIPARSAKK